MTKIPPTILIIPRGPKPEIWSDVSDEDFGRYQSGFYNLKPIDVGIDIFCEWMYNVKSGAGTFTVSGTGDGDGTTSTSFQRAGFLGTSGGELFGIGKFQPYHGRQSNVLILDRNMVFDRDNGAVFPPASRSLVHRGNFYLLFGIFGFNPELFTHEYEATLNHLKYTITGATDPDSGLTYVATWEWTKSETFY